MILKTMEEIMEEIRGIRLNLISDTPLVAAAAERLSTVIRWFDSLAHGVEESNLSESELDLLDTLVNQIRSAGNQKFVMAIETESGGRLYFASADAGTLAGWVYRTTGGSNDL